MLKYIFILFFIFFTAAKADTLKIGVINGPDSLDPHFSVAGSHIESMRDIYDTLLLPDENLQPTPGLAESWIQLDRHTWIFNIRKNVKFHDGSILTADDVKFSVDRLSNISGITTGIIYARNIQNIEVLDLNTVKITTFEPSLTLLNDLTRLFIVSKKAAQNLTKDNHNIVFNNGTAAIGTGPYKFISWTPKEKLILKRNEDYWRPVAEWENVIKFEVSNESSRVAQLLTKQLDLISRVSPVNIDSLNKYSDIDIKKTDTVYLIQIELDFRDVTEQITDRRGNLLPVNPLKDIRVRKALSYSIDRETLAKIVYNDMAVPANQMVASSVFGYSSELPLLEYNLEISKKLLKEAGYPDGFNLVLNYTNNRFAGDESLGQAVSQMLAKTNIKVVGSGMPNQLLTSRRLKGELSLSMYGFGTITGESSYTHSTLIHSDNKEKKLGMYNWRMYKNEHLDMLIQNSLLEMDAINKGLKLQDINEKIMYELPSIPIVVLRTGWAFNKAKIELKKLRKDEETLAYNIGKR